MKTLLINPYIPMGQVYGKYKKLGAVLPPLGLTYLFKRNNRSFVYHTLPQAPHILRLLVTGNTSMQL